MVRVRFAPSPTGIPHIGNTRTALFNYLFAKHHHGRFILRVEDTDQARLVPGSLEKILKILKIVGISWDEGPFIQSQRLDLYRQHALDLVKKGSAYYCFCPSERLASMRASQQKHHQLPKYDRHCLKLSTSKVESYLRQKLPYVIRLKVPATGETSWNDLIAKKISFQNQLLDDQVLLKSDGYPTYHLAVVVDDHLMNITHILRGVEWISSTPKHILLYQAFGWSVPEIGHFPVILGPDKAKLSKRHGAKSILDYQTEGYLPQALITFMAYLGWSYEDNSQLLTLDQLVKLFDLDHIHQTNAIFDIKKLDYFNAKLIRQTPAKTLVQLIKPHLKFKISQSELVKIIPLVQERLIKLTDINNLIDFFCQDIKLDSKLLLNQSQLPASQIKTALFQVIKTYQALSAKFWRVKDLEALGYQLLDITGLNPRQLFMTIRVALTGKTATPPLFDIIAVLGKSTTIKRLKHAQTKL
ncbi:MAG: glutamate--tRNA ligase [Candidatus Beckwithbacteria bacterium]